MTKNASTSTTSAERGARTKRKGKQRRLTMPRRSTRTRSHTGDAPKKPQKSDAKPQQFRDLTELVPVESVQRQGPFAFLVQHAPLGIAIVQNEKLVFVNQFFAKMLGYRSSSDLEGKSIVEFVTERSRRSYHLLERRKLRGEAIPTKFELRMCGASGKEVDVELSMVLGMSKNEPAVCLFLGDITDRKQLEHRLLDSDQLFRNVVNSMVDALLITDLQGNILDVNDGFERLTGYSRREVFHLGIPYPWVSEEDLGSYIQWLERLRVQNYLMDFDVSWKRKDGTKFPVSLSTTLLRNVAGEPALMVNIARDITERQLVQQDVAQQFQRLQVLYELSRALTEAWELHEIAERTYHQVKRVIPTDSFMLALYDEEKGGILPILSLTNDSHKDERRVSNSTLIRLDEASEIARVIASRKSVLEHLVPKQEPPSSRSDKSAKLSLQSCMYVPMFSKDRIIGVLSVRSFESEAYSVDRLALMESIASVAAIAIEKVKLYRETIDKSQEIEARNRELDDFTYVVSHDLKEPLISVEGYVRILRDEYHESFDETGRQFLRSVLDACAHMKRLIEDLLQLSRVGKLSEVKHEVDVHKVIDEVVTELQFSIEERQAQIKVAEKLPSVVSVEPFVKVIFRNLISNALKFCDKAIPIIEIGARQAESPIFYVRDNGIGIPAEYRDKIFMIFQRIHKREEYEGTGAGLTIAKKIIEVHGGRIWVDSAPGMGSTFYFTLPST